MKTFIFLITIFTISFSSQRTFILHEYDKEIELEAKIVFDIASSSIKERIRLFVPQISYMEKMIYAQYFTLTQDCKTSNFVFVNKEIKIAELCNQENKIFLTNNYRKLLSDNKYFGAFFWSKSRPNVVFIRDRLKKSNISLPTSYDKYIEDFNEE